MFLFARRRRSRWAECTDRWKDQHAVSEGICRRKKLAQDDQKKGSPLGMILACIGLPIFVRVSLCDTGMRNR